MFPYFRFHTQVDQTITGISNRPVFCMLDLLVNDDSSDYQHYRNSKLRYYQNFAGNRCQLTHTKCSLQHFQWLKRREIKSGVTAGKQPCYQDKYKIEKPEHRALPGNSNFFA